jgi:hypothetical protein
VLEDGEVLLFGCGKKEGVFATNKKLPPNPLSSDLSLQNKPNNT